MTTEKTVHALDSLAASYSARAAKARETLETRKLFIAGLLDLYVASLATEPMTETEETAVIRSLLGEPLINEYRRSVEASRALALLSEAERSQSDKNVPPATAALPRMPQEAPAATNQTKPKAPAPRPPAAPAGTVLLSGANAWNYYSLSRAAKDAAASANWPNVKLSQFKLRLAGLKKHAEVLALVRKSGLTVVEAAA